MLTVLLRPDPDTYPTGGSAFELRVQKATFTPDALEYLRRYLKNLAYLGDPLVGGDMIMLFYDGSKPDWPGFHEVCQLLTDMLCDIPGGLVV
jgi:hypothetical protein